MTFRPMIDNGLLSPSGRVSKRARQASNERVRRELFGDGMPFPSLPPQPSKRESLLRHAAFRHKLAQAIHVVSCRIHSNFKQAAYNMIRFGPAQALKRQNPGGCRGSGAAIYDDLVG